MSIFSDVFGSEASKATRQSEDIARQAEEFAAIIQQGLSQLIPGSPEYNELLTFGQKYGQLISSGAIPVEELGGISLDQQPAATQFSADLMRRQGERISRGEAATPLEARTDLSFAGLRSAAGFTPEEQGVLDALRGGAAIGGPGSAGIFADVIARAQNPDQYFTSTLQPSLALAQDAVKARAAQRGVLGSGLELEQLGRAGVDLAIKEAAQREASRQQAYTNFRDVYGLGQGLRSRQIGTEADLVNLQQGRESQLTNLLGGSSATALDDLNRLLGVRTGRTAVRAESALARQQAIEDQLLQALGETAGPPIGAAAGFIAGGPTGAAIGANIGGKIGGRQLVLLILKIVKTVLLFLLGRSPLPPIFGIKVVTVLA